ncbi:4Fe-4S binding protein [Aegicerativicinus sediminis]
MHKASENMAIYSPERYPMNTAQRLAIGLGLVGLFILIIALFNETLQPRLGWWLGSMLLISIGIIWFTKASYKKSLEGIHNHGIWFKSISAKGLWAWCSAILITLLYTALYFFPDYLGQGVDGKPNTGLIALFDPFSEFLSGKPASQWFVYGTLYTLAVLAFGYKFLKKYRHNRYQQLRTFSVMFFQLGFAFLLPEIMYRLNSGLPYYDLKNIWPLNYYNFEQYRINDFINSGSIGLFLLIFGVVSIFIITPILTYKYGKRWYCSWVCGCGGLAETAGDPFRHLSDKSLFAWKVERWIVHSVLVFVVLMTTAVIASYLGDDSQDYWLNRNVFLLLVFAFLTAVFLWAIIYKKEELKKDAKYGGIAYFSIIVGLFLIHFLSSTNLFLFNAETLRSSYGFLIGSIFSGVIGTGFYPIFGNRVWCRFGCPMAAILGFQQRLFSKFRITTNGGQCISCGNCSTYCEMGIDVRSYAQKGENIVRSSCVGCGICAAVCPRGVLKLENGSMKGRINSNQVLLGNTPDLITLAEENNN